ncbi:hypothetical protein LEMLEM_LOCUS22647 [Lemmus lemmus]
MTGALRRRRKRRRRGRSAGRAPQPLRLPSRSGLPSSAMGEGASRAAARCLMGRLRLGLTRPRSPSSRQRGSRARACAPRRGPSKATDRWYPGSPRGHSGTGLS